MADTENDKRPQQQKIDALLADAMTLQHSVRCRSAIVETDAP
jgi:hypothetical protein